MSTLPVHAGAEIPVRTDPGLDAQEPGGAWDWWLMGTAVVMAGFGTGMRGWD